MASTSAFSEASNLPLPDNAAGMLPDLSMGADMVQQGEQGLMDFLLVLHQTQANLQEMLMDLEAARIEVDLANERTNTAEQQLRDVQGTANMALTRCGPAIACQAACRP
jgi:hypothetical protein